MNTDKGWAYPGRIVRDRLSGEWGIIDSRHDDGLVVLSLDKREAHVYVDETAIEPVMEG